MEGYFLDTNLFVLLVVGSENRDLISKHRRLEHYSAEDYDILTELLENADQLFVTPNTLTETSNLVSQHGEPERSILMRRLRFLIHRSQEVVVASTEASSNAKFEKLGLTDAALLETVSAFHDLTDKDNLHLNQFDFRAHQLNFINQFRQRLRGSLLCSQLTFPNY